MLQLRWPYPKSPGFGAWGTPTSVSNFCEEDYIITAYIAEFVNTLTNLTYVIYGVYGLRRVKPRNDGGLFSTLAFPYWGLISVGLLSGWFHATLKYHSQMGDDLSMFLAVGALLHQLLTFGKTVPQRRIITTVVLGTMIPVSIYHCWADEIIVHQLVFGGMVLLCGRKARQLIRERIKNPESKQVLGRMASAALGSGIFGFFLWNIDVHLCSYVREFRHALGLPWGAVFELHGWWHIFTGIGAYMGMALVEYLVTIDLGNTGRIEEGFAWPVSVVLRDLEGTEGKIEGQKRK